MSVGAGLAFSGGLSAWPGGARTARGRGRRTWLRGFRGPGCHVPTATTVQRRSITDRGQPLLPTVAPHARSTT
jgi:hypothetical protein